MIDLIVKKVTPEGLTTIKEVYGEKEYELFFDIFSEENSNKRVTLKPKDVISIDNELLNPRSEKFSNPLCFEIFDRNKEKNTEEVDKKNNEFAFLNKSEDKIILKRIYG